MQSRKPKVFYGWWIVLAAFCLLTFTSMTGNYGFSVFYKRITDHFGWSRTALAGVVSLSRLEAGFLGGIEGFLVDRFGPRAMMLLGIGLSTVGMILLSRVETLLWFYIAFVAMVTVGRSLSSMIPVDTTVANWFIRRRGTAFGLIRSAISVGALGVVVVSWLIIEFGWRTTFMFTGFGTLLVGVPAAMVMRHKPEQYGMHPDGDPPRPAAPAGPVEIAGGANGNDATAVVGPGSSEPPKQGTGESEDVGMTVTEALFSKPFWALSFGFAIRLTVTGAATLHAIPLVEDLGYSQTTAAVVLGSMGFVSIIGRLGGGLLNDKFGTKIINILSVLLLAVSCLILANAQTLWHVYLFVALYAPSYGCSAATMPAIKADYFGTRSYGSILGLSGMVQMAGSMMGPLYAAWMFDTTGSYRWAFLSFAALCLISAALFASLQKPRYR